MVGLKTIQSIDVQIKKDLKDELRQQGHYLTGSLEDSISSSINTTDDSVALDVRANDYIDPLNTGVPAENIPYDSSRRSGAKSSKYIEGLKNYAKRRFGIASEKEALSAAFAIAKKHEKEGMPTKASYAYSTNNRRTEAIEQTYNQNEKSYNNLIDLGVSKELDQLIDKTFDKTLF